MIEMPGYCDFILQAPHTISQSNPQRCFAGVEWTISKRKEEILWAGLKKGCKRDACSPCVLRYCSITYGFTARL